MPEFNLALIFSSFIAGVFTFFAPCTLPLIPAFLGVISGSNLDDFKHPEKMKKARWWVFKNAVLYVLGFSLVFVLFGTAFSFLGQLVFIKIWLPRVGSIFIILFGLFLAGLLKVSWLNAEQKIIVPHLFSKVSLANSFLIGVLFALGWSPCVGPLLGSVLFLASTTSTVMQGTFLLIVFSLGLGLPFLITALFVGKAFTAFAKWGNLLEIINKVAGLFLVFLGILLLTGLFSVFHEKLLILFYQIPFFEVFINRFL